MLGTIIGIIAVVLVIFFAFAWVDRMTARYEAEEDRRLHEEIKHLPPEVQVVIWRAHIQRRCI